MHARPLSARALAALALFAVAAAPTAARAAAETYTIDKGHSEVAFQVRHLMTQVRGRFESFGGKVVMDLDNLANSGVEFEVDASSINTFNADRDQHLRTPDFFSVEKHPKIAFKSSKIVKTGDGTFDVTGTLQLRGVSREITLPVTLLGKQQDPWGNTVAGFSAETVLDRKDYGFNWNKALDQGGMLLGDEVKLSFSLETKLAKVAAGK
jgi:polyisoprenoid-binding protein YceI